MFIGEFPVRMMTIHMIEKPTKAEKALSTWNLGELWFGLSGLPSLIPLLVVIVVGFYILYRLSDRKDLSAA